MSNNRVLMKNRMALAVGSAMLLAALLLAASTSSQDRAPRPEIAQVLATALHVPPTNTPRPTFTSIPAATPRRITQVDPSDQAILDLLFQYPYWGAYIIPSPPRLSVQRLALDALAPTLIITGDGAEATDGLQVYPAAFGAVLLWDNEGYARKFLRVQFGHRDAQVAASITPDGSVVFILRDIGYGECDRMKHQSGPRRPALWSFQDSTELKREWEPPTLFQFQGWAPAPLQLVT